MDEWRTRLASELLARENAAGAGADARTSARDAFAPSGPTAMEIAFGRARSELTYVLELGRAHHLPIVGSVVGDDVWIRIGEARLAFTLDRAALAIAAKVVGRDETTLAWDDAARAVTAGGAAIDVDAFVREAIDATVRAWKTHDGKDAIAETKATDANKE
jgi:hypothetical protein